MFIRDVYVDNSKIVMIYYAHNLSHAQVYTSCDNYAGYKIPCTNEEYQEGLRDLYEYERRKGERI